MKKIILISLLLITTIVFASNFVVEDYNPKPMIEGNRRVDELLEWHKNHPGEMPPLTEQEKYEFFIKKGVPLPGSGAVVVEHTSFTSQNKISQEVNKFNLAQKTKGYYEHESDLAKKLLEMPAVSEKEYNSRKSIAYDARDTHLYEVKSNLAMKYNYKAVPPELATKVFGYAPESIFVSGGWAGAVEFFAPSFDGVCAFHEVNLQITKSSASIPKEVARYDVNKKITTINATGNNDSGFVYEVEWWDAKFKRTLQCATKEYSKETLDSTISLAKKIDTYHGY